MTRYNRILSAVCLTLGAVLMTVTLIGVAIMGTAAARVAHQLSTVTHSSDTAVPTAVTVPDTAPTTWPSAAPGVLDQCRTAYANGGLADPTYKRLHCEQYGG